MIFLKKIILSAEVITQPSLQELDLEGPARLFPDKFKTQQELEDNLREFIFGDYQNEFTAFFSFLDLKGAKGIVHKKEVSDFAGYLEKIFGIKYTVQEVYRNVSPGILKDIKAIDAWAVRFNALELGGEIDWEMFCNKLEALFIEIFGLCLSRNTLIRDRVLAQVEKTLSKLR